MGHVVKLRRGPTNENRKVAREGRRRYLTEIEVKALAHHLRIECAKVEEALATGSQLSMKRRQLDRNGVPLRGLEMRRMAG